MKNFPNQKKESTVIPLKKNSKGRLPIVAVHRRAASPEESAAVDRAIDRLLTELVRQARAPGEIDS